MSFFYSEHPVLNEYYGHLNRLGVMPSPATEQAITSIVESTDWENPYSGQDWNNVGVVTLIQAQSCEDSSLKETYLEVAQEAFAQGQDSSPLCRVHLSMIEMLLGNFEHARKLMIEQLVELQILLDTQSSVVSLGLIFFPSTSFDYTGDSLGAIEQAFFAKDELTQAIFCLNQNFAQAAQVFYSPLGLRSLSIASQNNPNILLNQLKYGISCLMNLYIEGLLFLHKAYRSMPVNQTILQSLFIAYRDLEQPTLANQYFHIAQSNRSLKLDPHNFWTSLAPDSPFTYLPFDNDVILTVQPSFKSIVTGVLLAGGDWFESEIQFWREQIKPNMVVIDVGANAGVYTYSAAKRVGKGGRVIAIEPFSQCVRYLEETSRVNGFGWVKVYRAAASDRVGTSKLALYAASELNEIQLEDELPKEADGFEEIQCLTLDSIAKIEKLERVDLIKIDAEGHEIQVLKGSQYLLETFKPCILYENIASSKSSNKSVFSYLQSIGYKLFYYQSFTSKLMPIDEHDMIQNRLNIIATPMI
jgi:FkbM family methyltransferase